MGTSASTASPPASADAVRTTQLPHAPSACLWLCEPMPCLKCLCGVSLSEEGRDADDPSLRQIDFADLALSLDVIYGLVENKISNQYMKTLHDNIK
jgi:hypothetical protein